MWTKSKTEDLMYLGLRGRWITALLATCPTQGRLFHGFEWPPLFPSRAPLTGSHATSHNHTSRRRSLLTLAAPWNYFRLEGMLIIKRLTVLEAITWYWNTSEGPKMVAMAFSFSVFKAFYFLQWNQLRIECEQWLWISFAFVKLCLNRKVILTEFICLGISSLL